MTSVCPECLAWDTLHWSRFSPGGTSWWTPVTFTAGSVELQPSLNVSFIAHQCIDPQRTWMIASFSMTQSCTHNRTIMLSNKTHIRIRMVRWPGTSVRVFRPRAALLLYLCLQCKPWYWFLIYSSDPICLFGCPHFFFSMRPKSDLSANSLRSWTAQKNDNKDGAQNAIMRK